MSNSIRRSLALALHALGDTAGDVADVLEAGGWRGFRNDSGDCPIARYLCTVVPDVTWAAVGASEATVRGSDGIDIEVELTPAVADFIAAFDLGDYPELATATCDANGDVIDDPDL